MSGVNGGAKKITSKVDRGLPDIRPRSVRVIIAMTHRDVISNRPPWPYGTQKIIEVVTIEIVDNTGMIGCLENATKEGFILLVEKSHVALEAKVGDAGVITFRQGGPKGGYWDYGPRKLQ